MPLKVAQVGNLENIICDLNEVTRRIHQNETSFEQQPQRKLVVLKLQFQSQNLSRTTTSTKLVGVEVIRSNIENLPRTTTSTKLGGAEAIHIPIFLLIPSVTGPPRKKLTSTIQEASCRPTQTETHFSEKENLVSLINTPPMEHLITDSMTTALRPCLPTAYFHSQYPTKTLPPNKAGGVGIRMSPSGETPGMFLSHCPPIPTTKYARAPPRLSSIYLARFCVL